MSSSDLPKLLRASVKPVHKCYLCTGFTEVLLILVGLTMTWYSKWWFPIAAYICGFMTNSLKRYWMVSNVYKLIMERKWFAICNTCSSMWFQVWAFPSNTFQWKVLLGNGWKVFIHGSPYLATKFRIAICNYLNKTHESIFFSGRQVTRKLPNLWLV